jgi:hypothetical protein
MFPPSPILNRRQPSTISQPTNYERPPPTRHNFPFCV